MIKIDAVKNSLRIVWVVLLAASILFYLFYGQHLTADAITAWIKENTHALTISYCILCIVRGFFLMPSTPFIFAGILLFPGNPWFLFTVSLACIFLSSLLIYYCSEIGFGDYFEKKYPQKIAFIREKLYKPSGFYFIALWSMLPFTPTDLIVYVGGSIKLPFRKVILPLMIGEAIIVAIYIFNGVKLMEYIR